MFRIITSLKKLLGRIPKSMVTSGFMTVGSVMIPIGFFLLISAYEFDKPPARVWAIIAFVIGFAALFVGFARAFEEEGKTRKATERIDKNSSDRHNEMKTLLQSINDKLDKFDKYTKYTEGHDVTIKPRSKKRRR